MKGHLAARGIAEPMGCLLRAAQSLFGRKVTCVEKLVDDAGIGDEHAQASLSEGFGRTDSQRKRGCVACPRNALVRVPQAIHEEIQDYVFPEVRV
jgi:hypothetical protein